MKVPNDVLVVLDAAETDGQALRLPGQLDRKLYVAVDKVLKAAGGKWTRGKGAHIFPGDAAAAIEQVILTGEITTAQDLGYFPTPAAVVEQMLGYVTLEAGDVVLEPSAGQGAIASRLAKEGAVVDCIELSEANVAVLRDAGYARHVLAGDFLSIPAPLGAGYDAVVMNPPFGRQADLLHVKHALGFVRDGGGLVAVMSNGVMFRNNRATVAFRQMVEGAYGWFVELPEDAFKESGTGVRTVLAVIPVSDSLKAQAAA